MKEEKFISYYLSAFSYSEKVFIFKQLNIQRNFFRREIFVEERNDFCPRVFCRFRVENFRSLVIEKCVVGVIRDGFNGQHIVFSPLAQARGHVRDLSICPFCRKCLYFIFDFERISINF